MLGMFWQLYMRLQPSMASFGGILRNATLYLIMVLMQQPDCKKQDVEGEIKVLLVGMTTVHVTVYTTGIVGIHDCLLPPATWFPSPHESGSG